ncbi:MAG: nuclear transport factor 2 family protein [Ilumatobacteraceae bacterium]
MNDRVMSAQRIADAVDHSEIRRLQDAYADIVTRRAWAELDEIFRNDTVLDLDLRERTLQIVGTEQIGEFIARNVNVFEFFQFGILGTRVHLRLGGDEDRASARMYMTEMRRTAGGHWSQIYGVYHDRMARIDDRWWFAHRTYHSLARTNLPAEIFDFPHHIRLEES